jgi:hypothetical protein
LWSSAGIGTAPTPFIIIYPVLVSLIHNFVEGTVLYSLYIKYARRRYIYIEERREKKEESQRLEDGATGRGREERVGDLSTTAITTLTICRTE